MASVTLTTTKKIGNISEVVEKHFIIPDYIFCEKDGGIMFFDSYHQAYICKNTNCNNEISAKEYVMQEIKKNKQKLNTQNLEK